MCYFAIKILVIFLKYKNVGTLFPNVVNPPLNKIWGDFVIEPQSVWVKSWWRRMNRVTEPSSKTINLNRQLLILIYFWNQEAVSRLVTLMQWRRCLCGPLWWSFNMICHGDQPGVKVQSWPPQRSLWPL